MIQSLDGGLHIPWFQMRGIGGTAGFKSRGKWAWQSHRKEANVGLEQ